MLRKNNRDGFQLLLTQEVENKISKEFATKMNMEFSKLENKEICKIKVETGNDAIWIKDNEGVERFYIRSQNQTVALSPRDAAEYIREKWRPKE